MGVAAVVVEDRGHNRCLCAVLVLREVRERVPVVLRYILDPFSFFSLNRYNNVNLWMLCIKYIIIFE